MIQLEEFYGSGEPEAWAELAQAYKTALKQTEETLRNRKRQRQEITAGRMELDEKISRMTRGRGLRICRTEWNGSLALWDSLADAREDWQVAENQLATVKAMARTAQSPAFPDKLTCSEADTLEMLSNARTELRQIESRLNLYTGRVEALGTLTELEALTGRTGLEEAFVAIAERSMQHA